MFHPGASVLQQQTLKLLMPMSEIDPRTLQLYNEEGYLFNEVTAGEADLLMLDTYLTDLFKTKQCQ